MGERGPLKLPSTAKLSVVREGDAPPAETAASAMSPGRPERPKGLPRSVHGLWDEIVADLDKGGLIAKCDAAALELALRHYAAAVKASNALMRTPVTQKDNKNDRAMKNPASQVFRDHSTAFLEFAKQLGLTFVSRARVDLGDKGATDGNPFA